jgi:hypothetical protein
MVEAGNTPADEVAAIMGQDLSSWTVHEDKAGYKHWITKIDKCPAARVHATMPASANIDAMQNYIFSYEEKAKDDSNMKLTKCLEKGDNYEVWYFVSKVPIPLVGDRDGLVKYTVQRDSPNAGDMAIVCHSIDHSDDPKTKKCTRLSSNQYFQWSKKEDGSYDFKMQQ